VNHVHTRRVAVRLRLLEVCGTVADLAQSDAITPEHFGEAIQYRTFDRTLWV
jgi:magnesium chelatase family protein